MRTCLLCTLHKEDTVRDSDVQEASHTCLDREHAEEVVSTCQRITKARRALYEHGEVTLD